MLFVPDGCPTAYGIPTNSHTIRHNFTSIYKVLVDAQKKFNLTVAKYEFMPKTSLRTHFIVDNIQFRTYRLVWLIGWVWLKLGIWLMLGLKLDLVLVKVQDRISQYVGLPTCTSLATMHSLPGGSKIWVHSINQKTAKDAKKRAKQVFRPPKDVCFPAKDGRNSVKTRKGDKKTTQLWLCFL